MEGNSEQRKKQFDWLKAYQWQKGQSGNPGGRPKKTMKVFAREFLESMSEEDRIEYFSTLDPEVVWKMAEGNPKQDTDIRTPDGISMVFSDIYKNANTPQGTSEDHAIEGQI